MGLPDKLIAEIVEVGSKTPAGARLLDEAQALLRLEAVGTKHVSQAESILPQFSRQLGPSAEYQAPGFIFEGGGQSAVEQIKALRVAADYKKLIPAESRVAVFGETHPEVGMRDELIKNMHIFENMGFTHLGMEALTTKRQPLLDAFVAGSRSNATKAALTKALNDDWGWTTDSYLKLLDSAKSHGLKIVALDRRVPANLEAASNTLREKQWAKVVSEELKEAPNARALMLVGNGHVGINPGRPDYLTSILARNELNPTVISMNSTAVGTHSLFDKAVANGGMARDTFAVPVTAPIRPADFLVNIPPRNDPNFIRKVLVFNTNRNRYG